MDLSFIHAFQELADIYEGNKEEDRLRPGSKETRKTIDKAKKKFKENKEKIRAVLFDISKILSLDKEENKGDSKDEKLRAQQDLFYKNLQDLLSIFSQTRYTIDELTVMAQLCINPETLFHILMLEELEMLKEKREKERLNNLTEQEYRLRFQAMLNSMRKFYTLHNAIQQDFHRYYNLKAEIERLSIANKINKVKANQLKREIAGLEAFLRDYRHIDPSKKQELIQAIDEKYKILDNKRLDFSKKRDEHLLQVSRLIAEKRVLEDRLPVVQQKLDAIEVALRTRSTPDGLERKREAVQEIDMVASNIRNLDEEIQLNVDLVANLEEADIRAKQEQEELVEEREIIEVVDDAARERDKKREQLVDLEKERVLNDERLAVLEAQAAELEQELAGKTEARDEELRAAAEFGEMSRDHVARAELEKLIEKQTNAQRELGILQESDRSLAEQIEQQEALIRVIEQRISNPKSSVYKKRDESALATKKQELLDFQAERTEKIREIQQQNAKIDGLNRQIGEHQRQIQNNRSTPQADQGARLAQVIRQFPSPTPPSQVVVITPHRDNIRINPAPITPVVHPNDGLPSYEESEAEEERRRREDPNRRHQ